MEIIRNMSIRRRIKTVGIILIIAVTAAVQSVFAQDERPTIDVGSVAKQGQKDSDFVPKGWKIEEKISGDLNQDKITDYALTLVEDRPSAADQPADRNRALVILLAGKDGTLTNAAVADKLLRCTSCGGAFYGVMDAPASVKIEKGVIVIGSEYGSRWVSETTYRFRYDEQPSMFILIGFDYASRDRAKGDVWVESTNYLTGKRITTIGKGKRDTKKTTNIAKKRYSIGEIDYEKFEDEANKRLGID